MKKIFAALCTLMIVPTLTLANSDMVSVSELRQQVERMDFHGMKMIRVFIFFQRKTHLQNMQTTIC